MSAMRTDKRFVCFVVMVGALVVASGATGGAQGDTRPVSPPATATPAGAGSTAAQPPAAPPAAVRPNPGVIVPGDYVVGPDDVLTIVFWREKNLSGEVIVRPDGKITLPLINDIPAAGLTPEELRLRISEAAARFVENDSVTVSVKEINSRKVFITGMVNKPGPYPLLGPTSVVQLIAMAGGLLEYADSENISVVRPSERRPHGEPMSYRVNYKEIVRRANLRQNIELKPGDTVMVP